MKRKMPRNTRQSRSESHSAGRRRNRSRSPTTQTVPNTRSTRRDNTQVGHTRWDLSEPRNWTVQQLRERLQQQRGIKVPDGIKKAALVQMWIDNPPKTDSTDGDASSRLIHVDENTSSQSDTEPATRLINPTEVSDTPVPHHDSSSGTSMESPSERDVAAALAVLSRHMPCQILE